jgi:hypothetical protein
MPLNPGCAVASYCDLKILAIQQWRDTIWVKMGLFFSFDFPHLQDRGTKMGLRFAEARPYHHRLGGFIVSRLSLQHVFS